MKEGVGSDPFDLRVVDCLLFLVIFFARTPAGAPTDN